MGRIETGEQVLVDIEEACGILERHKTTLNRLTNRGHLHKIHVAGDPKIYFTLESVELVRNRYKSNQRIRDHKIQPAVSLADVEPDDESKTRKAELKKNHPELFS